ncbi:MAG: AAC(3) family N-acetyltransferase [Spirochaetales bacterium]|nr:AAC(3) family N-acetyltransferase [Spirochaetales bacterium]
MFEDLLEKLRKIGILKGDILYIPSDITQLLLYARKIIGISTIEKRNEFLNKLVDSFKSAVGNDGTLLFPIFTWDFNKGIAFNARKTLGKVGSLPNWILQNRTDFIRTQHPMYSFMVWGKDAKILSEMNNVDCWGQYSPFGYMHRNNAKILFLDVPVQRGFTFLHYVEESLQVPYRYYKNFRGNYIDFDGNKTNRNYVMYVRDLLINSSEYMPDSFFEEKNVLHKILWNETQLKIMNCVDAFMIVKNDLLTNNGRNMYHFENYTIDWNGGHTHADEISN